MKHLGDITKINGAAVEPVDVIIGGSPCQDLSVAGKREGLSGERSGLFMEQIRIIKEMRKKSAESGTDVIIPRFMVFENVTGAFSSNKGEDFRTVLEEFVKINEPTAKMPKADKGKWPYADIILGTGWSIAYRTFDLQYWGCPQRRKRIYLVADFRGECAGKILFERQGLPRDFAESEKEGKEVAADAESGINKAISFQERAGKPGGGKGILIQHARTGASLTLNNQYVCYAISSYNSNCMKSKNPYSGIYEAEKTRTIDLNGGNPACNQGGMLICLRNGATPIVRRLTPLECNRLQGFPDGWGEIDYKDDFDEAEYQFWLNTRNTWAAINGKQVKDYTKEQMLKWYNKLHTDSAEYKMWGNGIGLPNALYVMEGIAECNETEEQHDDR